MTRLILFIFGISLTVCNAQIDPGFIKHLSDRDFHKEVIHLTEDIDFSKFNRPLEDSLLYLRGWSYYNLKLLDQSYDDLIRVGPGSPFYDKSHFFAAYNQTFLENYSLARKNINEIKNNSPPINSLKHFGLSAISLLEKDFKNFEEQIDQVDTTYFALKVESAKFKSYALELIKHRKKSSLLAGVMSAVIPGSGKMYAGKTAQGISSLITVAGLGLVTLENYNKLGPKNFKTIIFGSAFAVFYIANIYGAVFSVKIAEIEYQNEYKNKILFHFHIPLRTVFN